MSREICINLTRSQAIAARDGATCLILPTAVKALPDAIYGAAIPLPKWAAGDVLIGREAWCHAVDEDLHVDEQRAMYAIDEPDAVACDGDGFTMFNADGSERKPWRSAATMPKALARHRWRVLGVRVCQWGECTLEERQATALSWLDMPRIPYSDYVSVTRYEPI